MATAEDVARFMLRRLREDEYLYQSYIATEILDTFGEEFVYWNRHSNLAIRPLVLRAFRKLTGESVVWVKGERYWRKREEYDQPGREVDY